MENRPRIKSITNKRMEGGAFAEGSLSIRGWSLCAAKVNALRERWLSRARTSIAARQGIVYGLAPGVMAVWLLYAYWQQEKARSSLRG